MTPGQYLQEEGEDEPEVSGPHKVKEGVPLYRHYVDIAGGPKLLVVFQSFSMRQGCDEKARHGP